MANRSADSDNSELRAVLQQQVFNADQERLILAVPVLRSDDRKRRLRYLCLAVRRDNAYIYVVKQDRKTFRKKSEAWPLASLREVNGKSSPVPKGDPSLDFELTFQDQKNKYEWTTTTISDKHAFFVQMSRLHRRYTDQPPLKFVGLEEMLEDELARTGLEMAEGKMDKPGQSASNQRMMSEKEGVLIVTQKEQEDLEQVFRLSHQFEYDGEVLVQSLTGEMNQMESANVHDLMNTHNDIESICRLIDQSVDDLSKMDTKISKYHGLVGDVSEQVTMMDETGHKLKVQNKNIKKLIQDISLVLETLEFSNNYRVALMDGDIMNQGALPQIMNAADALSHILKAVLPPGFEYHPAVIKQKRTLDTLKKTFGNRVAGNLSNNFTSHSNTHPSRREELILPSHAPWFNSLTMYYPVVKWMKENISEPPMYQNLLKTYIEKLGDLYRWEHAEFSEKVKARISSSAEANNATKPNPEFWLGWEEETRLTPSDFVDYQTHLENVRVVFSQMAKCVIGEQKFLVNFFHIPPEHGMILTGSGNIVEAAVVNPGATLHHSASKPVIASQTSVYKSDSPLREVLKQLFKNLDEMLGSIVTTADRANKLMNLGLLVTIHEILVEVEPECPYLSKCYGGILIMVKRNFDTYVKEQVLSVQNAKVPKRSRFGPLPFVCNFEHFAKLAEHIFADSQRRIDLDRAYSNLLRQGLFEGINRIANHKDCKAPAEVVFLENYHRLSDILSRLKIASLEENRREIRQRYKDYQKSYVQGMLGKPLDKVQVFFDGVDAKIQTAGIQPHEIAFTTQFSKAELRKVLAMYPRSVVKKGLEQLYKKVEKQLSDEENLLQVVWRDMQQEFIEQYQNYLRIIEVCYPNSQIVFGFGIDDILKIFEEIAASH